LARFSVHGKQVCFDKLGFHFGEILTLTSGKNEPITFNKIGPWDGAGGSRQGERRGLVGTL